MMKKQYLSIAVALALSSAFAQADVTINKPVESETPYEVSDDLLVNKSLTAPSISVGKKLTVNGTVASSGGLIAGTLQTMYGTVTVGKTLTITGNSLQNFYGKIEANELHFDQPSTLLNRGTITVKSLTGEGLVITNHLGANNLPNSSFTITNMPTEIGSLTNYSAFKVGSAGDVLKVTGDVLNGTAQWNENATITSVDGEAIGLNVGGAFSTDNTLTLTQLDVGKDLNANADLTVLGNVSAQQKVNVKEDKTLDIKGNLDVSEAPYQVDGEEMHSYIAGTLNVVGDAKVATAILPSTAGLSVGGVLTITGQWFQYQGESSKFNVDHIVMDHQPGRMNSAVLSLEGAGDYHLSKLELKNSTNKTERFNGVQLHNANLSVDQMVVHENTVGMIDFEKGTKHKAGINNLTVAENGTFLVGAINGSLADQSQNNIVVANASFADNTTITRKQDYDEDEKVEKDGDVGLIFKNLTAEGNLNISSMDSLKGGHGALTIETLHAKGGAVTLDQQLQGASAVVNIAQGASVAMNKGTSVDSLTVNMSTLAKDSLYVDSVGENTKTKVNVDGKLNNKDAASMIEELDLAVQIGTDDKGSYDFVINEGDVFGAVTGNSADYEQAENTKLVGLESVTALSALSLRHEMNSLSKRMGELRDAPAGVGAWARAYGSEMEYGKQNVKAKNASIQVGSDYTIGDWKVGAALTYTDGESSYDKGSADNKGYGASVYGTWFIPCGAYVDLIAKYNRLDNDFGFSDMKGSYKNDAYGVSAETGYRFTFLNEGAFVEPQLALNYGYMTGDKFVTSNGVTIDQDDYNSLIGRLGVRTGFKFPKDKGMIYARVSGVYDFLGDMDAIATKGDQYASMSEDLGGAWLEMGVGANFNWTKNTYTYIDFERTNGGDVKENYRWNVGVRHNF